MNTNKLIEMVDNAIEQIKDFKPSRFNEEILENIANKANKILDTFSNIRNTVSSMADKVICVVRIDKAIGEKLSYSVKNGELKVKVTYNDETTSNTRVTNVMIEPHITKDDIKVKIDNNFKLAVFTLKDDTEKNKAAKRNSKHTPKSPKTFKRDSKGRFVRTL